MKRCLTLLFLVTTGGCASEGEPMFPVQGRVTLAGKPILTGGTVSFRPDASRANPSHHIPMGQLDAEGRYRLTTVGRQGAPPGWYRVVVMVAEPEQGSSDVPRDPKWLMHRRYLSEQTTDLVVEVVSTPQPGAYDLSLAP